MAGVAQADDTDHRVTRASAWEAAALAATVVLPALLGGVVLRRPAGTASAERLGLDRRGIEQVRALRRRHGPGLVRFDVAGRTFALVLDAPDVRRVLQGTPEPFTPASREKRKALGQFQPHGVLVSTDPRQRAARRRANEAALEPQHRMHTFADHLVPAVRGEAADLLRDSTASGALTWDDFAQSWWRTVRRVVFGVSARDDTALTARLHDLRAAANWSALAPERRATRRRFLRQMEARARRAEHGTLAAALRDSAARAGPETDVYGQVPHWLFAFDAAGIATLRALALLATHPQAAERARREAREADPPLPTELPYLRACLLESVRLWPTTPLLLRESTRETDWYGTTLPAGTGFVLYTPYLQRGGTRSVPGDAFAPDAWRDGRTARDALLVPFSAGPARCPGENVVLLTASTWLAAVLGTDLALRLLSPNRPDPARPLPATLDHFALRFGLHG